ncbi:MAG: hypothetical protein KAV87_29705 [Desulfobacteraceae bacterium]|nr:hypothetical protein [Desulfobacteraceae bacterium]
MNFEIIGAESLGVRGISCVVEVKDRQIVIDPGRGAGYCAGYTLPGYANQISGRGFGMGWRGGRGYGWGGG